jgi:hypothetical protein
MIGSEGLQRRILALPRSRIFSGRLRTLIRSPNRRCGLCHGKSGRIRPSRRLDSVGIRALHEIKSGGPAAPVAIRAPNGTNRKHLFKTMPSKEGSITAACYLCNTHSKTDKAPCPEAVPLLRV